MMTHPFANVWEIEHLGSYGTNLTKSKWRSIEYNPTLSWSYTQHFDLIGSMRLQETLQTENVNTLELTPIVGARVHLTPNSKILTRVMARYEFRNIKNLDTKEWSSSGRTRVRIGALIPLNNPTMFNKDKLWYGIMDGEWFFVVDEEVKERYANRFRFRAGLGYRLTYNSRFEFIYTYQESRNKFDNNEATIDNIFRIRFRHFINKSKPSKTLGIGN